MRKSIILVFCIFFLLNACETNNPVNTNTEFHKVTMTMPDNPSMKNSKAIITFGDKLSATPPESYYFSGKNLTELWGAEILTDLYYNFFYINLGNIKKIYEPEDPDFPNDNIIRSFEYDQNGLISEILINDEAYCFFKYNSENKISEIRYEPPEYEQDDFRTLTFKYGSNGYIENYIEQIDNGRTLNYYNEHDQYGFLKKSVEVDTEYGNDTTKIINYFYSNDGKLSKKINNFFYAEHIEELFYDSDGKLIKRIYYYDGNIDMFAEYIYNNNDYLIEIKEMDGYNLLMYRVVLKYE